MYQTGVSQVVADEKGGPQWSPFRYPIRSPLSLDRQGKLVFEWFTLGVVGLNVNMVSNPTS